MKLKYTTTILLPNTFRLNFFILIINKIQSLIIGIFFNFAVKYKC